MYSCRMWSAVIIGVEVRLVSQVTLFRLFIDVYVLVLLRICFGGGGVVDTVAVWAPKCVGEDGLNLFPGGPGRW